jgi:F-type H+-transporting ATPase subunit delta
MAKVTPKNLGLLLYDLTDGRTEEEQKKALKEFVSLVAKKRMMGKMRDIITEYRVIYNKAHNIIEATITLTSRLDENTRLKLRESLKKKYKAREVHMLEKVDARLLGGMKVKIGDTVHDTSLLRTLNQLQAKLTA